MVPRAGPRIDGPRWGPRQGAAAQLVVLCHGVGADGHDLIDLAPHWAGALDRAAFASPDAPDAYDQAPAGRQWFSLADRAPARLEAGAASAAGPLGAFIDAELDRLGLPATAYALVGFSQGALMALHVGLRRAVPPRAIVAYSGALLAPDELAGLSRPLPPVLLVHGDDDQVVPAERSREAAAALVREGVAVETLFCPHLGHAIDDAGLSAGALFLQKAFAGA